MLHPKRYTVRFLWIDHLDFDSFNVKILHECYLLFLSSLFVFITWLDKVWIRCHELDPGTQKSRKKEQRIKLINVIRATIPNNEQSRSRRVRMKLVLFYRVFSVARRWMSSTMRNDDAFLFSALNRARASAQRERNNEILDWKRMTNRRRGNDFDKILFWWIEVYIYNFEIYSINGGFNFCKISTHRLGWI